MGETANQRVANGLAANQRLTRRLVLLVSAVAATALLGLSLASGMLAVEVVPPAEATTPAAPTTQTPGQPSTGPATSKAPGGAAPSSGLSRPPGGAPRATAAQQQPPATAAGGGPDARPGGAPGAPPAPSPRPGLVRVRVRPVGVCVEVLAGVPPVRTCRP